MSMDEVFGSAERLDISPPVVLATFLREALAAEDSLFKSIDAGMGVVNSIVEEGQVKDSDVTNSNGQCPPHSQQSSVQQPADTLVAAVVESGGGDNGGGDAEKEEHPPQSKKMRAADEEVSDAVECGGGGVTSSPLGTSAAPPPPTPPAIASPPRTRKTPPGASNKSNYDARQLCVHMFQQEGMDGERVRRAIAKVDSRLEKLLAQTPMLEHELRIPPTNSQLAIHKELLSVHHELPIDITASQHKLKNRLVGRGKFFKWQEKYLRRGFATPINTAQTAAGQPLAAAGTASTDRERDLLITVSALEPQNKKWCASDQQRTHPASLKKRCEAKYLLRGSTPLAQLCDKLCDSCPFALWNAEPVGVVGKVADSDCELRKLYPGRFIFIHDTFFIDANHIDSPHEDPTTAIRSFLRRKQQQQMAAQSRREEGGGSFEQLIPGRNPSAWLAACLSMAGCGGGGGGGHASDDSSSKEKPRKIHPHRTREMGNTTVAELTLRLGQPYLFGHLGGLCEHLLIFSDLRLLNVVAGDEPALERYPLQTLNRGPPTHCLVCRRAVAAYVVAKMESPSANGRIEQQEGMEQPLRLPALPTHLCAGCFEEFGLEGRCVAYHHRDPIADSG